MRNVQDWVEELLEQYLPAMMTTMVSLSKMDEHLLVPETGR